jgi:hypothetical protein
MAANGRPAHELQSLAGGFVKRHWNWRVWAGFGVTLAAVFGYFLIFVNFPVTRDFPWATLLLFAVGGYLAGTGLYRAYARPAEYHGKVSGAILGVLSVVVMALFCYIAFVAARQLPPGERALRVGQHAPDFTLPDVNGQMVELTRLQQGKRGTLLIFYRGYW